MGGDREFQRRTHVLGEGFGHGMEVSFPSPCPLLCTSRKDWQEDKELVLGNRQVGQDPSWSKVVGEEVPGEEEGEGLAMGKGVGRGENPMREQEQQVWGKGEGKGEMA